MKIESFHLELITPCFCGGAEPEKQAEIRAPSIRGLLRWWFRTLGGFRSLAAAPVSEQEAYVFGTAAGTHGKAGKLIVRVRAKELRASVKDGQELGHPNFSPPAYLTFPIQSREKNGRKTQYAGRGVLTEGAFELVVQWQGDSKFWDDVRALIAIFGELGSLGYRSRRAMGALAFTGQPPSTLQDALSHFSKAQGIQVKCLPANSAKTAISILGSWWKSCRAHGRSDQNETEQQSPYFNFAQRDHDIGYNMPSVRGKPAYRPALGLPIIQRTQHGTNNWEWDWNVQKEKAEGRFASPILLRPHRDEHGKWHALVIFVDAHKWPAGKKVSFNGQQMREVSAELYETLKSHKELQPFPQ